MPAVRASETGGGQLANLAHHVKLRCSQSPTPWPGRGVLLATYNRRHQRQNYVHGGWPGMAGHAVLWGVRRPLGAVLAGLHGAVGDPPC